MVAAWPSRAKYTADGAARINAPFPAARWLTRKSRAAAVSQGSPPVRTASVCRPMSFGPAAAQRRKRPKTSGRSRPPRSSRDSAVRTAICVSSVASPGSQPPPPHISPPCPGRGKRAEKAPSGPNSNGALRASPTAEPSTVPIARSRTAGKLTAAA
jgi:hypothetical protein